MRRKSILSLATLVALIVTMMPLLVVAKTTSDPAELMIQSKTGLKNSSIQISLRVSTSKSMKDLLLKISAPKAVKINKSTFPIHLNPGSTKTINVVATCTEIGTHPIDFRVTSIIDEHNQFEIRKRRNLLTRKNDTSMLFTDAEYLKYRLANLNERFQKEKKRLPNLKIEDFMLGKYKDISTDKIGKNQIRQQEQKKSSKNNSSLVKSTWGVTVKGIVKYCARDGSWKPFKNATVHIRDRDTWPNEDDFLGATLTDEDGAFSVTVSNSDGSLGGGVDIYARIYTKNEHFEVVFDDYPSWEFIPPQNRSYIWNTSVHENCSDGVKDLETIYLTPSLQQILDSSMTPFYNRGAQIFQDINKGWKIVNETGRSPNFLRARFPWATASQTSEYAHWNNEIHIPDTQFADWDDRTIHLYGLHVLRSAYNGYWPADANAIPGYYFSWYNRINKSYALVEGWANFFTAVAKGTDSIYVGIGESYKKNLETLTGFTPYNASSSEAHVAAALFDLWDQNNEITNYGISGFDQTTFSFKKILSDLIWGQNLDNIDSVWSRICSVLPSTERLAVCRTFKHNKIIVDKTLLSSSNLQGGKVVFISDRVSPAQLFTKDIDNSSPPQQLTHENSPCRDPKWSPNGRYVAYIVEDVNMQTPISVSSLNVIDTQTGQVWKFGAKNLLNVKQVRYPTWHRSGKSIAFTYFNNWGTQGLAVLSFGNPYEFDSSRAKTRSIVPLNTTPLLPPVTEPVFSEDGNHLYFHGPRGLDGFDYIYKVSKSGGAVDKVFENLVRPFDLSVSPNGKIIIFNSELYRDNIPGFLDEELVSYNKETGQIIALTQEQGNQYGSFAVGGNGEYVMWSCPENEPFDIFIEDQGARIKIDLGDPSNSSNEHSADWWKGQP